MSEAPAEEGPGEAGAAAWLEGVLSPRAGERERLLVFPSQAVADAWARAAPARFNLGAVETDRFLGWDRFKELVLSERREERPADRMARRIWAAGIVARQREKPFLSMLAGPGAPSPAFTGFFAALPPALDGAARLLSGSGGRLAATDGAMADLVLLRDDYASFLDRHGLFEPAWDRARPLPGGRLATIIAPELIEDFAIYEDGLAGLGASVEIVRLPGRDAPAARSPTLLRFENSYEELRWTFLEIDHDGSNFGISIQTLNYQTRFFFLLKISHLNNNIKINLFIFV